MTEGDTWLVDTLYLCQLLQGRALDKEPGKVSLKLLFCFLFSPHLSPPLSLYPPFSSPFLFPIISLVAWKCSV